VIKSLAKWLVSVVVNDHTVHPAKALWERFVKQRLNECRGRFWKSRIQHIGATSKIAGDIVISSPSKLVVGEYVRIGRNCTLSCEGGLTIGDNSQLSRNILIYTNNHDIDADCIPYDNTNVLKPVVIGKSVWIGMNACITPGVTIGDGAVIGMGTVVSKDVPPGAIVVGGPQRIVGERDMGKFERLQTEQRLFGRLFPDD
jgi:acetyltransferase-like isoleucine patch superfamily enzyme